MKKLILLFSLLIVSVAAYSQTFTENMLGKLTFITFISGLLFAGIGILITLLVHSLTRDKESERTPVKYSFTFMLYDNWKRILLVFLCVLVTIRFFEDLTPWKFNMLFALAVGGSYDGLAAILMTFFDGVKKALSAQKLPVSQPAQQ